jgi:hypothetical protein
MLDRYSQKERMLIWLAAINVSLPNRKQLSDTEIQLLAELLAKQLTQA